MKERTFVGGLVTFLVIGSLLATGKTDVIFVAATLLFFLLCIAYAEGCERL
jgi:succinate-acetate transporter protein